jgi:hypothetical protein
MGILKDPARVLLRKLRSLASDAVTEEELQVAVRHTTTIAYWIQIQSDLIKQFGPNPTNRELCGLMNRRLIDNKYLMMLYDIIKSRRNQIPIPNSMLVQFHYRILLTKVQPDVNISFVG